MLRFFYDFVFLLDMIHTDQYYYEGLEMEYMASRTWYNNVDDASVFLSFKNILPMILGGQVRLQHHGFNQTLTPWVQ